MWRVSGKRREFKVRGIRGSVDTPVGNSTTNFEGGHFSLKGERGRQLKITPVGPPSRLKADQSLGYGLIESRRAGRCGMVGLIAAHHLPTLQRSTSLLRDLYAVSSRARTHARTHVYPLRRALLFAASRIKLEGVSAILNFLLNPCQRVFSRILEDLLSPLTSASIHPLRLSFASFAIIHAPPSTLSSFREEGSRNLRSVSMSISSTRKPDESSTVVDSGSKKLENNSDVGIRYGCKCLSVLRLIFLFIDGYFFFVADTPSPYSSIPASFHEQNREIRVYASTFYNLINPL